MLGAILFLVFFLLIAGKTRGAILGLLSGAGDWIVKWSPFSFIFLAILMTALLVALVMLVRWPKTPEPDDPLAKYKKDPLDNPID